MRNLQLSLQMPPNVRRLLGVNLFTFCLSAARLGGPGAAAMVREEKQVRASCSAGSGAGAQSSCCT